MISVFGKLPTGERLERIRQTPTFRNGQFHNLSHTPMMAEDMSYAGVLANFLRPQKGRTPGAPISANLRPLADIGTDDPQFTWFGHSSYLLSFMGKHILVDPVFSGHASPLPFMVRGFRGTEVFTPEQMPAIDVLLITHDHYDHLDHSTLLALRNKVNMVVCSLGVGAHLVHWGYDPARIHELYWNESVDPLPGMQFTAVPARHFSGRALTRNRTLWSAFVLEWNGLRFFLGGDSGYDTHFADIGRQYGRFDVAILECGQYNPAWKYIHMMPEETVQAAIDLQSELLIPVHWGKFNLSLHAWTEPADRALAAALQLNMPHAFPHMGSPYNLRTKTETEPWWK